jgi:hypothetical protein
MMACFMAYRLQVKWAAMKAYRYRHRVLCLFAVGVCCVLRNPVALCADEIKGQPSGEGTSFPELPKVNLAQLKPVDGETGAAAHWSRQVSALIEAASKAGNSPEQNRHFLAAANILLARQIEPLSSLAVLGLRTETPADDKKILSDAIDQAERLIGDVRESLSADELVRPGPSEIPGADEPKDASVKSDREQLSHCVEVLQSFLNGQRAYLLEETEPGARRRAASALAPLLEDADKKIASAARLWQALLRGLEADPTAALQILGSPMTPPHPETWPYGLFSRVIRCRYQAVRDALAH